MKKRILSLILALSMVLSVFPLGAFAEGSLPELVMENGLPDCSGGTSGNGWSYDNNTQTLTLTSHSGTYDFSSTHPQGKTPGTSTTTPVACAIVISSGVEITGGTFAGSVTNWSTISGGTFQNTCSVKNNGTIKDNGIFEGKVTNYTSGTILDGTFRGEVDNSGAIEKGTFEGSVQNNNRISGGTFQNGCSVTNLSTISGGTFQNTCSVTNHGYIKDGTFAGEVTNNDGTIYGGIFAGSVENKWKIYGGVFNGNATLTNVTGGHNITWDAASSKAKIEKVNDVSANWAPYAYAGTTVTITASTKIYSLNGKRIGTDYNSSYPNKNDKKTVTFTMPDENVVLSTGELVIGSDGYPVGSNGGQDFCSGNDWEYSNYKGTLHLSAGTFDLSTTEPVKCEIQSRAKITGGTFNEAVTIIAATITKGIFSGTVYNSDGKISGGAFQSTGSVTNWGDITGGTFAGSVENKRDIYGGVFNRNATLTDVPDGYSITWDAASSKAKIEKINDVSAEWDPYVVVTASTKDQEVIIAADTDIFSLNGKSIGAGNCNSSYVNGNNKIVKFTMPDKDVVLSTGELVMEGGYPIGSNGGTANCEGKGWTYSEKDASNPKGKLTLTSGTFDFSSTYPQNTSKGAGAEPVACAVETQLRVEITGGTFEGEVINNDLGEISGGTFHEKVSNYNGMIIGGTFKSSVTSTGNGRIFGGVFNSKTTQKPATDAYSITLDDAYPNAKITEVNGVPAEWEPYVVVTEWTKNQKVIITADTDIYSLNGKLLGEGDHVNGNKNTVKFTMPDKDVVLNGAITCTDLVMENGWPKASNEGKISCSGTGWSYDQSTKTLTLTDGTFNLSSTAPGKCEILLDSENAKITGGTFEEKVTNNGGTISDGTFNGTVENYGGTISSGTFKGTVQHWYGTISGGTFHEKVLNSHGEITGGTFAAGLSANNGAVTGGVFNGNTGLNGVTGLHSIKWDDAYPNAKIEKVNGVSANWAPYVVVTEWTTATAKEVTITADTEIFSLNGRLLGEGDRVNGNKNTVKFTMPDDMPDNENVVLNKAITSTDLVMENGWPKDSSGGKIPCKGDGWQYIPNDPTYGNMLLLTGSNQTGGLFDFSTIGDGSAVDCNVFVGKPTAITGGEFNGKVINNSHILGGTFHGEVDNMGPSRIVNGTFKNSVENNGMIENGAFHDAVKNNGTINDGTFHGKVENNSVINSGTFNGAVENNGTINGGVFNGAVTGNGTVSGNITGSGTLNGEPITKTPEPEPEPEPEPTTYTVTVIGGTIDGKTSVSAKEKDTLTVVLDQSEIPDGMTFDMWSISSSKLSGDINVDYRAEAMTFKMPAEDVTIRAQYRSAEIIEDAAPSPLATAATIAVGGAAAGIVVWQGVNLGVDLYLANALPQGVPVPTDRRALALLLWETAGKPEVALPTLYSDIPAEEIELQKATRWAVQNGLMDAADKKDASFFDPDHYVTKMDVFGAWLRLKKLLGTT